MWDTERADGPQGSCEIEEIQRDHAASLLSLCYRLFVVYISGTLRGRNHSLHQHSEYELLSREYLDEAIDTAAFTTTTTTTTRDIGRMVNLSAIRIGSVRCECLPSFTTRTRRWLMSRQLAYGAGRPSGLCMLLLSGHVLRHQVCNQSCCRSGALRTQDRADY
jgi:hypothetical protein